MVVAFAPSQKRVFAGDQGALRSPLLLFLLSTSGRGWIESGPYISCLSCIFTHTPRSSLAACYLLVLSTTHACIGLGRLGECLLRLATDQATNAFSFVHMDDEITKRNDDGGFAMELMSVADSSWPVALDF